MLSVGVVQSVISMSPSLWAALGVVIWAISLVSLRLYSLRDERNLGGKLDLLGQVLFI